MSRTPQRASTLPASPHSSGNAATATADQATFDRYVGIPWQPHGRSRAGVDCWGLVWLFHVEEFGVFLPSGGALYDDPNDRKECSRIILGGMTPWLPVAHPLPGDVVLLARHGLPCHVGLLAARGWLLHVREGIASAQVPIERARREGYTVAGHYRHQERQPGGNAPAA